MEEQHPSRKPTDITPPLVEITPELSSESSEDTSQEKPPPPWQWKLMAVILVSLIRFGSSWGSGITSTMKSTLKKELHIKNTQYALLEASENFMDSILILFMGFLTDRFGGASMLFYGNIIYSVGSLLIAAAAHIRSYPFMIVGHIISAFGDVSTQIAQYQVFSSWFAPSNGFASTLGLELMIQKLGALAGSGTSNVISKNIGFSWVYWISFFVNLFTNVMCAVFYWFSHISAGKYGDIRDPATGGKLSKKTKKVHLAKVFELPWTFWTVLAYSMFTTTTIVVFNANSTELAEQRFEIDSVKAGWYTSLVRYGGFFLVPALGIFVDLFGNRITLMALGGGGVLISMTLLNYSKTISGTIAAYAVFGVFFIYSPMSILDAIRTSLKDQTTFGTAYAAKSMMSNSMSSIIRVIAGVLQDADGDSYHRVVVLFMILASLSLAVSVAMAVSSFFFIEMESLQWTRKQRLANSDLLKERIRIFYADNYLRNRRFSQCCFAFLVALLVGSWACYIYGSVTGANYTA